jgi:rhamnosyltransferase
MRSYNDIDVIADTLNALQQQTYRNFELWNHDSSSVDGTLSVIRRSNDESRILVNDPAKYNPGRVLNSAARLCNGEVVVFLNSDATPGDQYWLENLVAPLLARDADAVFGRQVARPGCRALFVKDTERAFGDGRISSQWTHFFSMANSAVRKEVLKEFPFSTAVQYSEDIEWSLRLKRAGHSVKYVSSATAVHSHNYSLTESYRRHFGEGRAEAQIFDRDEFDFSLFRYLVLPLCVEVLRDFWFGLRHASIEALLHAIPLRLVQKFGRYQGARSALGAQ